jgi:hypothetical protein
MNQVTVHNVSIDELHNEIRQILKEELGKSRESKEIWVSGEKDAAQILGISVGTISSMVQSGKLEGCYARIGLKKLNFNISKIRAIMQ